MYITNTTDNVRNYVEEIGEKEDLTKLKFLIYIFGLLNNNLINDKNEVNPELIEDDDMKILTYDQLGLPNNYGTMFLQYLATLYNSVKNANEVYEDNGNIIGMKYSDAEKQFISQFEKLTFNEKLDVLSEIIIRYDNETYFNKKNTMLTFDSKFNGFDLAKRISNYKNKN